MTEIHSLLKKIQSTLPANKKIPYTKCMAHRQGIKMKTKTWRYYIKEGNKKCLPILPTWTGHIPEIYRGEIHSVTPQYPCHLKALLQEQKNEWDGAKNPVLRLMTRAFIRWGLPKHKKYMAYKTFAVHCKSHHGQNIIVIRYGTGKWQLYFWSVIPLTRRNTYSVTSPKILKINGLEAQL